MKDSWIPDHQAGMFNSLSPIPATAKVRFLMNDRGTAWEEDSVRAFFHEELADKILGVPISRLGGEDFVSWPFDKHGVYSVKSGYNLAKTSAFFADREAGGKGSSSDLGAETVLWKAVWTIKAPEKMKVVLWRIIHDCLPTGQQLVHRHIPADDCCLFCGQLERVEHLFLLCPYARAVWEEVKIGCPLARAAQPFVCNISVVIPEFIRDELCTDAQ
jgi:hypothetical protein